MPSLESTVGTTRRVDKDGGRRGLCPSLAWRWPRPGWDSLRRGKLDGRRWRRRAVARSCSSDRLSTSKRANALGMPILLSSPLPHPTLVVGGRRHPRRSSTADLRLGWSLRSLQAVFRRPPSVGGAAAPPWSAAAGCRGFSGAGAGLSSWPRGEPPRSGCGAGCGPTIGSSLEGRGSLRFLWPPWWRALRRGELHVGRIQASAVGSGWCRGLLSW
jgi:hypothetical protein